eukprot:COSAG01_NODE_83_length_27807_cov_20.014581_2_plen_92_part_00
MAALTMPHGTTDPAIARLTRQCDTIRLAAELQAIDTDQVDLPSSCSQLGKAMVLYSARNRLRLVPSVLFAWDAEFASAWYTSYFWLGECLV